MRVVAYLMRLIPKNEAYGSETGIIADPSELENAQTKLFYMAQLESFPIEKKLLLKNSPSADPLKFYNSPPSLDPTVYFEQLVEQNNLMYLVLMQNIPSYWTVAIQSHVYSSNIYTDLIATRVWTT